MHVDYLTITVPETHLDSAYKSVVNIAGECNAKQRPMPSDSDWLVYDLGDTGVIKHIPKDTFSIFSASGDALRVLRDLNLYNEYLWSFAEIPHRVTSLDIAHDIAEYTPKVLKALWRKAHSGGIQFTRKRLLRNHITTKTNLSAFDSSKTGSLYLGTRKHEAHAIVYDKRQEMFDNHGYDIGHWLSRYELTVTSKMGITLRDASEPEPVFWHFMKDILTPPSDLENWEPGAEGFNLPPRVSSFPAARLRHRLESSAELRAWVDLADQIGPHGRAYFLKHLQKAVDSVPLPDDIHDTPSKVEGS
jgi:hypothetical protein